MKIGQMASYLDDGLPEPVRAALAELQQDAPPMAPELAARRRARRARRRPRARLRAVGPATDRGGVDRPGAPRRDARRRSQVAVKVQYPGVDDAIRADLVNTDLLFRAHRVCMFPGLDPKPLVEELRARLVEELDYRSRPTTSGCSPTGTRATRSSTCPRSIDELSTARVLTTELATGARFAEVEGWSQDERDLAAEAIFRFVFRSIYRLHAFNGDPHPGNYLFRPGGQVTFLDFGLVKRYTPEEVQLFQSLIEAFVHRPRRRRASAACSRRTTCCGRPTSPTTTSREYFGHFYEFVLEDRELAFTPEYASESVRRMFDPSSPYAHVAKSSNVPPAFVITQRINLGLHAVLGRCARRRNWRRIAFELWPFVDGPPSTPMGEAEAEWLATHPSAR